MAASSEGLERDDRATVARSLKRIGHIDPGQRAGMQREAFFWAHELGAGPRPA